MLINIYIFYKSNTQKILATPIVRVWWTFCYFPKLNLTSHAVSICWMKYYLMHDLMWRMNSKREKEYSCQMTHQFSHTLSWDLEKHIQRYAKSNKQKILCMSEQRKMNLTWACRREIFILSNYFQKCMWPECFRCPFCCLSNAWGFSSFIQSFLFSNKCSFLLQYIDVYSFFCITIHHIFMQFTLCLLSLL